MSSVHRRALWSPSMFCMWVALDAWSSICSSDISERNISVSRHRMWHGSTDPLNLSPRETVHVHCPLPLSSPPCPSHHSKVSPCLLGTTASALCLPPLSSSLPLRLVLPPLPSPSPSVPTSSPRSFPFLPPPLLPPCQCLRRASVRRCSRASSTCPVSPGHWCLRV